MMLGIEGYGSDDDDSGNETPPPPNAQHHPSSPNNPPGSRLSLPPPKSKNRPKKVKIGLPALSAAIDEDANDLKDERPAKKPRLTAGTGSSSLLSMLPAPKQKNPSLPAPERVLGGGRGPGLVFNAPQSFAHPTNDVDTGYSAANPLPTEEKGSDAPEASSTPFSFLPPSLAKGRSNISLEEEKPKAPTSQRVTSEPTVDFFSLGTTSSSSKSSLLTSASSLPSLSSAPNIPIFTPPEPTPTDEYPGYYQLPSGAWAAYDPTYYAQFAKKWEAEYNAHVRALEKGMVKGFEGLETATVEEVNAMKEMEKAKVEIQEREERKAITKGADGGPVAPKMNINASKLSGRARSRHQLSTLLNEAYTNREALEEKIAEGRRNRKEAGNKYGF